MPIGSCFSSLFHRRDAGFVDPDARGPTLLSAQLGAAVTAQQVHDLDRGLAAIRALPGGAVVLDALRALSQATGKRPHIVLTHDRGQPHTRHVSAGTWRVCPRALLDHPQKGLQVLALLYEDLARPRDGRFHGVAHGQLPQPGAELQAKWQDWAAKGMASEKRFDAVRVMWNWFEESTYYGGLNHEQMIGMLDHIALNEPVPEHVYAELNLSDLSLPELPEVPQTVYALRADDNDLETLNRLPDQLRILRLNRVFKRDELPDLARQLSRLPDKLIELELDGNQLGAIMRAPGIESWTLPKHLKLLSLSRNGLFTLPVLPELTTLYAANNRLMTIPVRALAKTSALRTVDLSNNFLDSIPNAIRRLPRSCEVHLSGNPLTTVALQIAERRNLAVGAAFWQVADEMRRAPGPRIIYHTYEPASMPTPAPEEPELPTSPTPAELETEIGFWLGEKRMKTVAQSWRSIADQNGAGYFLRMLQRLRLFSANRKDREFQESVAEYLTEFMRPERAELRTRTLAACQDRTARCVDDATLAFVQLKILRANDDVARGVYDQHPKELVELGEQLFVLDILTKEAVAKGNALSQNDQTYRQEFVETVLACYVHFRKKLGLTLVVPDMNYKFCSGLGVKDFDEIEAAVEKKRKEFPYYLNVEWEGWKNMLKRNFADGYARAESRRHDDLEKLDGNITLSLRQKGWYADGVDVDADLDVDMRHQESLLVCRKMDYERMAPLTRAYLKSVGKGELALHAAPELAPAIDETRLIVPI